MPYNISDPLIAFSALVRALAWKAWDTCGSHKVHSSTITISINLRLWTLSGDKIGVVCQQKKIRDGLVTW